MTLLEVLPILSALDVEVVDEHPYVIRRDGQPTAYLYDFGLTVRNYDDLPGLDTLVERFSDAFIAAYNGLVESDAVLGLVTRAGLTWRQASFVQAWVLYSHQIGSRFSYSSVAATLISHPDIVRTLVEWFTTRFDPELPAGVDRQQRSDELAERLARQLDEVLNLTPTASCGA